MAIDQRRFQTVDKLYCAGKVIFDVELHGLQGASEEWAVTAGIDYELG
jgi:hypothetical protein